MLSISGGSSTRYLTDEVSRGAEAYYTGAVLEGSEPPGTWWGDGAASLGLVGEVDAGVMEAGELSYPQRGAPQGGVVSPVLSERSDKQGYGNLMVMGT